MQDKPWAEMTPEERRASRIDEWRNPDIEFASPETQADYQARIDRILAAINHTHPHILGYFFLDIQE